MSRWTTFADKTAGRATLLALTVLLALPGGSPAESSAGSPAESSAVSSAESSSDTQGFIYGRVTMRSDTVYEGRLRWNGDEEAFWGDLFNGTKEDRPYWDDVPERERKRDRRDGVRILGIRVGWSDSYGSNRSFVARFGDIDRIEANRGDAVLTMKDGEEIEIDGSSTNDIGSRIDVWDREVGHVKLDFDRIDLIEFLPAPADLEAPVTRLHGRVETEEGVFEGYIQWDKEECLSTDELDGDSRDGSMSIEMGKIRRIERRSSRASLITLWSGRELELRGTNDVNSENRGIYVEDPRYGRVLVSWDSFESLEFSPAGGSGPAYGDFEPGKPLRGTVTESGGKTHSGRIVYDIDEEYSWEILNGEQRDLEYNIPFALVKSVEPRGIDSSRVTLTSGEELILDDVADVGEGNDGILVLSADGDSVYVAWDDVERVEFQDAP